MKQGNEKYINNGSSTPYSLYELYHLAPGEPAICKRFACGKHLSLEERLHGDYCFIHSLPEAAPEPTDFISY